MRIVNVKNSNDYDVYGGRTKSSGELKHMNNTETGKKGWLGNPYTLDEYNREKSIELFEKDFKKKLKKDESFKSEILKLEDKVVACWCKPKSCHLEVIKRFIEQN